MEVVLAHVLEAVLASARQLSVLFGWTVVLSVLVHCTSTLVRASGSGLLGGLYYYLVAPGVMCHETGHALGCILTGTKIVKFVPFAPRKDTLGYVSYRPCNGVGGALAELVISSGPVWFGCLVLALAIWLFSGTGIFPAAPKGLLSLGEYSLAITDAVGSVYDVLSLAWRQNPVLMPLVVYGAFCIASEMTLSTSDLSGMWKGILVVVFGFFLINLIPGVTAFFDAVVGKAAPFFFPVHVILLVVAVFDVALAFLFRIFSLLSSKKL